jgi:hypothetical protein
MANFMGNPTNGLAAYSGSQKNEEHGLHVRCSFSLLREGVLKIRVLTLRETWMRSMLIETVKVVQHFCR